MGIFEIADPSRIEALYAGWPETFIWSFLQGYMGFAWADHPRSPRSAKIMAGDFCLFAGKPNVDLILHRPKGKRTGCFILVPQNEAWSREIEQALGNHVRRITRYATRKDPAAFDCGDLERLAALSNPNFQLRSIDELLFRLLQKGEWSHDLCSQFADYADYERRGIGVAALYQGTPVAGASSYTVYRGGIEIEIDTRVDFRRQGLATACGARLILNCLERGLYPSWDAHSRASLSLAEKLGYKLDRPYPAYEYTIGSPAPTVQSAGAMR